MLLAYPRGALVSRLHSRLHTRLHALFCAIFLVAVALPRAGEAQDIELLGEFHGTRPPPGYFEQLARDPASFRLQEEGVARLEGFRRASATQAGVLLPLSEPGLSLALGPRSQPVAGTFRFPVVLGLFSDSPPTPPFTRAELQVEYFDGPNSYHQTIPELYTEMSGGLLQLVGVTQEWARSSLTRAQVTLNQSGLVAHSSQGVGGFIESLLMALDQAGMDWAPFDQTGDGFVDLLSVLHPTGGAECQGGGTNRIWSHRWNLRSATSGRLNPGYRTSTPRADGQGFIYINDYTIQPVLNCGGDRFNEIGTFAHELGHGFGLPDLYPTGGQGHRGAGNWDLMGTGSWGCQGNTPSLPCHLGAWSKAVLGWVTIDEVPPGIDAIHTLDPVILGRRILRIPAQDGSSDYLLLENRQRLGSDQFLLEPGLLVWQIDQSWLNLTWSGNAVNNNASRMAVWLRQANGENRLAVADGYRGGRGDPFPGCIKATLQDDLDPTVPCAENREFHAGREPRSLSRLGVPLGVTLTGIELIGVPPHDVRFRLNTRRTAITLLAEEGGAPVAGAPFEVNGSAPAGTPVTFHSFPFVTHALSASPGFSLAEGVRTGFLSWADGGARVRHFLTPLSDTTLTARYGGREVRVRVTMNDPSGKGIAPGSIEVTPWDGTPEGEAYWVPEGASVSLEARPRPGFSFREWGGQCGGNPFSLHALAPTSFHALFDQSFAILPSGDRVTLHAGSAATGGFQTTEGSAPVVWRLSSGHLPEGVSLAPESGALLGAPMETGSFPVEILATDGLGVEARAMTLIEVLRPQLSLLELLDPFLYGGEGVTSTQGAYLDREGNRNGVYDIGDLRRHLLDHPELRAGNSPVVALSSSAVLSETALFRTVARSERVTGSGASVPFGIEGRRAP